MTDLHTENARLRAALEEALRLIDACINEDVTETTDWEKLSSDISSILATPAPDAVQEAARVPTAQEIVDAWLDESENFSTRRERMMDYCFRNDISHNIMTSWLVAAADAALRAIAGDRT